MSLTIDLFTAHQWIDLPAACWQAIEHAYALLCANPEAEALFCAEKAALLDVNGAEALITPLCVRKRLLGEEEPLFALLVLLSAIPDLAGRYKTNGISNTILRDTLRDIPQWVQVCYERLGKWGMLEYGWLLSHFRMKLFRLGRLQFGLANSAMPAHVFQSKGGQIIALAPEGAQYLPNGEASLTNGVKSSQAFTAVFKASPNAIQGTRIHPDGRATTQRLLLPTAQWRCLYSPGDCVIEIHIPAGEALPMQDVFASLHQAKQFFALQSQTSKPSLFVCESWLMDDALPLLMPESNIAAFSKLFYRVPFCTTDRQMLDRVFGFDVANVSQATRLTQLQTQIGMWYDEGNRCKEAFGFIPIAEINHSRKQEEPTSCRCIN